MRTMLAAAAIGGGIELTPGGVRVHVPLRVIPNGDGAEVVFTLFPTESRA